MSVPDDAAKTPDTTEASSEPSRETSPDGEIATGEADAVDPVAGDEGDDEADTGDDLETAAADSEEPDSDGPDAVPSDVDESETAESDVVSSDTSPDDDDTDDTDDTEPDDEPAEAPVQRLKRSFRPSVSRSQLMVGLLCALLGFAVVVQVRQSGQETLSSLRQDDLVRLLDEVTVRADQLDGEVTRLRASRDELASGTGQAQAALDVARQRATSEGILSGRLPAEGPGVVLTIREPDSASQLKAQHLFNLLEELRNAGAEVVQVNDVRLVASSSFVDGSDGSILVDGTPLARPYRWRVIGDPATVDRALEIPGGALPTIRNAGGSVAIEQQDHVTIDATVEVTDPRFASAAPQGDDG